MQYARLGNSGLIVSRLSFGAMTFGQGTMVPGVTNRTDQSQADQMIGRCIDAGINLFDTADAYMAGQSETILGRALGNRRKEVLVSTKTGFRMSPNKIDVGLSRRRIMLAIEASLKRLETDYVDIYFVHIPDPHTPLDEVAMAMDNLVQRGLVRYVGFSNLPAWMVARYVGIQERMGLARFIVGQMYYSMVGRDLEIELVPCFEALGIGTMAWSPLAGGFLTGKYTRENPAPPGTRREKFSLPPVDVSRGYEIVEVLNRIARNQGVPSATAALAWTLTRKFMDTMILGANSMEQLEQNLKCLEVRFSNAEIAELDEISKPPVIYPQWMMPLAFDKQLNENL